MQQSLTQSPTLHLLRRNRKDPEYLRHDLDDYASHGRSRGDPSVYLKSMEETFDAIKNLDELVSVRAGIFSRLRGLGVKNRLHEDDMKDTYREENANPREDYVCWWKRLKVNIRARIFREKCIDTH